MLQLTYYNKEVVYAAGMFEYYHFELFTSNKHDNSYKSVTYGNHDSVSMFYVWEYLCFVEVTL